MHVERNRIFVGNLPPSVNEKNIREQFEKYGKVVSVEIKQRKENVNENVSPVFAFVSIEADKNQLYECFQSIANYNWNGYYVKLELAKESFLERLKREREEAQNANQSPKPEPVKSGNDFTPSTLITASNAKKKVYTSSTSSSSSDDSSEDETPAKKTKTQNGQKVEKPPEIEIKPIEGLVIKNNKNKHLTNGKIKIESVNSTPIHVITQKQSGLYKDGEVLTAADEKRLNALYKLKENYNQQKNLIKNALSKIDTTNTNTNKIVFDDEGKQTNKINKNKQNYNGYDNDYRNKSKNDRVPLFEGDEEDDENYNFNIKNQFEGKKGQRLLELQSKFTNDKRFTLDSRFVEDDYDDDYNQNDEFQDDEKQKQYEILESVIGRKIHKKPEQQDLNKKYMSHGMLRYDPTNVEHSKFEIRDKPSNKKDKPQNTEIEDKVEEVPVEVSKEKFYKVTDNLKQTFKENEGFSLLNMFGRTAEEDTSQPEHQETKITKSKFDTTHNPFRYDSSDSEDENVKKVEHVKPFKANYSRNISGEKLFFQNDDERLKEGLNFLKKFGGYNNEENAHKFVETRREIKQIIRAKVRNVQRNNRPFRQKIGQHKHIKIKKAKKN